ncbi:MAG TPA: mycofactocin oligosaccharide methyltransferase MftM [Streptosporangiaceae bacterium]|nr:mycofactocin oligosaccharide methyltransferase MftM [Streptosporangiaceae bacterium]
MSAAGRPGSGAEPVEVLRSCPDGRYEDRHVVVEAGPAPGLSARLGPDGRIWVRHGWRPGELDDELAGPLAAALGRLTDDHEVFGRVFSGIVLTSQPDATVAWDGFYRASLARLHRPPGQRGYSEVYRHALDLLPGTTVADLGCGFGFLALHLAARGAAVTACDITPGVTGLLRRMAGLLDLPLDVVTGDAGSGRPALAPADAVALLHVLEHVDEAAATALISEATRIARHRVVVAVPYETTPAALFGHVRTIGARQLDKLGAGSGWNYQVHEYHGGWLVLDRPGPAGAGTDNPLSASFRADRRAGVVEEGGDVAAEQVRLLGGWEVAAARHGRPPADVIEAFGPLAGRRAVVDELVRKDSYRGGHRDPVGGTQFGGQPPVVHVVPHGGRDRLSRPVQGHHSEQEVAGEGGIEVPAGIGPPAPLLQHPGRQASW